MRPPRNDTCSQNEVRQPNHSLFFFKKEEADTITTDLKSKSKLCELIDSINSLYTFYGFPSDELQTFFSFSSYFKKNSKHSSYRIITPFSYRISSYTVTQEVNTIYLLMLSRLLVICESFLGFLPISIFKHRHFPKREA